ncbi:hypothetical protein [uncultured Pseudodesulfovibrio sp.]|uniref:hypothetical protein n=1 Tax=uncultured Pseudodesulfovibrio sp. TaxID=2035858 RepID=UPI00374A241E
MDKPRALHHIIRLRMERRNIFRDDADRNRFVDRPGKMPAETATPCFAQASIPNHFHLPLKTGNERIAKVMQRLFTGCAATKKLEICGSAFGRAVGSGGRMASDHAWFVEKLKRTKSTPCLYAADRVFQQPDMEVIADSFLQIIRELYMWGEPVKRSVEWMIARLIKVGGSVSYHAGRRRVYVASAFPLTR